MDYKKTHFLRKCKYWKWIPSGQELDINIPYARIMYYHECQLNICKEIENILSKQEPELYKDINLISEKSNKELNKIELKKLRKWSNLGKKYYLKKECKIGEKTENKQLAINECAENHLKEKKNWKKIIQNTNFYKECNKLSKKMKKMKKDKNEFKVNLKDYENKCKKVMNNPVNLFKLLLKESKKICDQNMKKTKKNKHY